MIIDGIDLDKVILVLATISAFVSIIGLSYPLLQRDKLSARVREVTRHRAELSERQKEMLRQPRLRHQSSRVGLMKAILNRLKIRGQTTSRSLRMRLAKAGWRGQAGIITYMFLQVLFPLVFALVAAVLLFSMKKLDVSFNVKVLLCVLSAALGFYLPNLLVTNMMQKRQQALQRSFPDALDLLVLCVEAGLSLDAAFSRVADDMEATAPILSEEFGLTTVELALLGDRRTAFLNLAERSGVDSFKALSMALIQAEKYGTSLGVILRVLAKENRDARMLRAEEKAGKLPATLTVPMIVFFLPVLFVVIIGPAIIQTIRTFQ